MINEELLPANINSPPMLYAAEGVEFVVNADGSITARRTEDVPMGIAPEPGPQGTG